MLKPVAFEALISHFVTHLVSSTIPTTPNKRIDVVVGLDARGFLFGPIIASREFRLSRPAQLSTANQTGARALIISIRPPLDRSLTSLDRLCVRAQASARHSCPCANPANCQVKLLKPSTRKSTVPTVFNCNKGRFNRVKLSSSLTT